MSNLPGFCTLKWINGNWSNQTQITSRDSILSAFQPFSATCTTISGTFLMQMNKVKDLFSHLIKRRPPKRTAHGMFPAKMFWGQSDNNGFNLYSWNNKYFLSKYHYFYISYIIPCMTKIHLLKQAMEIADKKNTSLLKSIITIFDLITTVPRIEEGV